MTITKHVIKRFQERITFESADVICSFIISDLESSILLYRLNHIEKRICNGVIYILDYSKVTNPRVVTLYLAQ